MTNLDLPAIQARLDAYFTWAQENQVPHLAPSVPDDCRALLSRVETLEAAMREIADDLTEILDEPGVRGEGPSSPERSLEIARRALEGA